ncbi:MAG: NAD(P)/FAD-dependent oxidoreductase [Lachnospiraceae bacterium]|nr:NAD(P)/FAD-dependent oxidoreductase [Lachnospiraceae bacterium]
MAEIRRLILKKLRIPDDRLLGFKIVKQSIDARKKDDVKVIFSIDVRLKDESGFIRKNRDKDVQLIDDAKRKSMKVSCEDDKPIKCSNDKKVVVVGAGPAGLMCAYRLAYNRLKPILLERGEDVDSRLNSVEDFWQGKPLNPSSNVQFGEGGAGTFSDGKLNTMVKDHEGYMKEVYRIFIENGADESILYINKPHIGTDKLKNIVKSIRKKIIELGGEVRFSTQMTDIIYDNIDDNYGQSGLDIKIHDTESEKSETDIKIPDDKTRNFDGGLYNKLKVTGVVLADGTKLDCDSLVLALGHSARDTFEMLKSKGVYMEQKPFAIGIRVQHPRDYIDTQQYGDFAEFLPAADYKLTLTREGKRSVYSFCMCPGGYVVNASSEPGRLAVNGMSYSGRDGKSSNAAIVVAVSPDDYPGDDPLAGMYLQRKLEEDAYNANNGKIPVQSLKDFAEKSFINCDEYIDTVCSEGSFFEDNMPDCKGLWEYGDINTFLPEYITKSLLEAFPEFGKSIKGYNAKNTLLLGLESRTSSPVRISRGEDLQSVNVSGLYPCGEGAGYAGGITSAAMDGLKVADRIISDRI